MYFCKKIETMKKFLSIIAVLMLIFASCDNGNIIGGRYFGTFHNTTNDIREEGSLNFKHYNINNTTYFLVNGILPMKQIDENKYSTAAEGNLLEDFLETIPVIDSLHVCDSAATILRLDKLEVEFKGGSAKTTFQFFTTNVIDSIVEVEFVGYIE